MPSIRRRPDPHATEGVLEGSDYQEEIRLELDSVNVGIRRYREKVESAIKRGDGASLLPAYRLMAHWWEPLRLAIMQERRKAKKGTAGTEGYARQIMSIDANRLTLLTLRETISACMESVQGAKVRAITYRIGASVLAEMQADIMRQEHKTTWKKITRKGLRLTRRKINRAYKMVEEEPEWPAADSVRVGAVLMWCLIQTASAAAYSDEFKLAFHHTKVYSKGKMHGVVKMDVECFRLVEQGHEFREFMRPSFGPMIVPPLAWTSEDRGGYLRLTTGMISRMKADHKSVTTRDMPLVWSALNAINGTSWRINRWSLDLIEYFWKQGGGLPGIPTDEVIEPPPRPEPWDRDSEEGKRWRQEATAIHNRNDDLRGQRTMFLRRMSVANRMKEYERLWFPHILDFRGRTYPIPIYLNHQGDDVCRALLEFSEPTLPGDDGRRWLRIHAANCFGIDKVSYDQRVQWTIDNAAMIEEIAHHPIQTVDAWKDADNPWQFASSCRALHDPEHASRIPVQLDGTCNGLQHYAAIGRDAEAAALVNMVPQDEPSDLYSAVAEQVAAQVEQDAEAGDPVARGLVGLVDRKVVKQPTMTSVYGVTQYGAGNQIKERLLEKGVDERKAWKASGYLAKVVRAAVTGTNHGATGIMAWVKECAGVVAGEKEAVLAWESPMGWLVVQPYRIHTPQMIKCKIQAISFFDPNRPAPPAKGQQSRGAAPNWIHSIDASHMMMVAHTCWEQGVTYGAVHDSFWFPAAKVTEMAGVIRRRFVDLHAPASLTSVLHRQWQKRYEIALPLPPPVGDYDVREVLRSPYFFH